MRQSTPAVGANIKYNVPRTLVTMTVREWRGGITKLITQEYSRPHI
jgi:hypothetical protein